MKILVFMGRGGTGKTSFTALTARYLIERGVSPILLVDADPDQNLGEMVGVDLEAEGRKTISDLLVETFLLGGGTTYGVPPFERIESRIWEQGLYEGDEFDFLSIGTKWLDGCYCLPNAALKEALTKLAKIYRYVLIDSPAGLEHLNRRITSTIDDIFDLIDPSSKSAAHVARAYRVIKEVGIEFKNFYIVGGYRFTDEFEKVMVNRLIEGVRYVGRFRYDPLLEKLVLAGRPLFELPEDSPAYQSVKEIMSLTGHPS